jgi:outer membrane protein assembly factor BamB
MVDRHHRTTSPLYAGGRLFVPGNDHVFAVDAYNGSPLWDHPVKEFRRIGIMRDCGSMAATDDVLYVAAGGECLRFEAASGTPLPAFAVPKSAGDATWEWGYVAIVGDRLFGTAVRHGASRRGHSRAAIEEGAYFDNRPIVVSDRLFCMDRNTGEMLWTYDQNQGALLNPTITIGGRRVFFVESDNVKTRSEPTGRAMLAQLIGDGATLVALDAATGKTVWKTTPDVSAIEQHLYLAYAESVDRVVAVGSRNQESGQVDDRGRPIHHVWYDTHAIDAKSGKPVWFKTQNNLSRAGGDHGEQDHHPVIVGDRIYVEPFAYDLKTGDPLPGWKLNRGGHGCGAVSASLAAGFFRADNPTMCDLATGQLAKVNRVTRPGCWISVLPAGGLVLMPEASSGCSCDFPLQTSMAFIPQRLLQQPTSAGLTGGSPKNGAAKPVGGR